MIDIEFEIAGRKVRPGQMKNPMGKAIFKQVRDKMARKIGNIRDPKTGQAPKVICKGSSLSDLSFEVIGSEAIINEVNRRFK